MVKGKTEGEGNPSEKKICPRCQSPNPKERACTVMSKGNRLIRGQKNMKEKKQKLLGELKNTPVDASQVHCSVSFELNREETLSVQSKVLTDNNLDENQLRKERQNMSVSVYVLNMRGKPLMSTTPRKARYLLKHKKAKVVKRNPFILQLNYPTGETKQEIILGIDAGYSYIGFSAVSEKKELISGEVNLRKDISKNLEKRAMCRKKKRNKLWYRKPRFDNRNIEKDWLAPSIKHKLDTHIRLIEQIKYMLPISEVIIEKANFDTQKMQNSEISGIEYQQGKLQGYEVKEYLLDKWERKCAYCNKKDIPLEIEHIIPKSRGGSNRVFNLTLSCRKCNLKKGSKTAEEFGFPDIQKKAKSSLKATAFMNIVKNRIVEILGCKWTYGYITKHNRIKLNISKSHSNDAFVIAKGNGQERAVNYTITQIRRNNRCLQLNRKGFKPSIRRQRYELQPHSLVYYNNSIFRVAGVHSYGKYINLNNKCVGVKKVKLCNYMRGWQFLPNINKGVKK